MSLKRTFIHAFVENEWLDSKPRNIRVREEQRYCLQLAEMLEKQEARENKKRAFAKSQKNVAQHPEKAVNPVQFTHPRLQEDVKEQKQQQSDDNKTAREGITLNMKTSKDEFRKQQMPHADQELTVAETVAMRSRDEHQKDEQKAANEQQNLRGELAKLREEHKSTVGKLETMASDHDHDKKQATSEQQQLRDELKKLNEVHEATLAMVQKMASGIDHDRKQSAEEQRKLREEHQQLRQDHECAVVKIKTTQQEAGAAISARDEAIEVLKQSLDASQKAQSSSDSKLVALEQRQAHSESKLHKSRVTSVHNRRRRALKRSQHSLEPYKSPAHTQLSLPHFNSIVSESRSDSMQLDAAALPSPPSETELQRQRGWPNAHSSPSPFTKSNAISVGAEEDVPMDEHSAAEQSHGLFTPRDTASAFNYSIVGGASEKSHEFFNQQGVPSTFNSPIASNFHAVDDTAMNGHSPDGFSNDMHRNNEPEEDMADASDGEGRFGQPTQVQQTQIAQIRPQFDVNINGVATSVSLLNTTPTPTTGFTISDGSTSQHQGFITPSFGKPSIDFMGHLAGNKQPEYHHAPLPLRDEYVHSQEHADRLNGTEQSESYHVASPLQNEHAYVQAPAIYPNDPWAPISRPTRSPQQKEVGSTRERHTYLTSDTPSKSHRSRTPPPDQGVRRQETAARPNGTQRPDSRRDRSHQHSTDNDSQRRGRSLVGNRRPNSDRFRSSSPVKDGSTRESGIPPNGNRRSSSRRSARPQQQENFYSNESAASFSGAASTDSRRSAWHQQQHGIYSNQRETSLSGAASANSRRAAPSLHDENEDAYELPTHPSGTRQSNYHHASSQSRSRDPYDEERAANSSMRTQYDRKRRDQEQDGCVSQPQPQRNSGYSTRQSFAVVDQRHDERQPRVQKAPLGDTITVAPPRDGRGKRPVAVKQYDKIGTDDENEDEDQGDGQNGQDDEQEYEGDVDGGEGKEDSTYQATEEDTNKADAKYGWAATYDSRRYNLSGDPVGHGHSAQSGSSVANEPNDENVAESTEDREEEEQSDENTGVDLLTDGLKKTQLSENARPEAHQTNDDQPSSQPPQPFVREAGPPPE